MNCEEFTKLISRYTTDDDFPDDLAREFKDHYLSCDECWQKYQDQLTVLSVIESESVDDLFGDSEEPDRVEELLEYAEVLQEVGKHEEAIKCLEEALELRPGDDDIKKQIGLISQIGFFELTFNGVEQIIKLAGNKAFVNISKSCKALLKFKGEELLNRIFETKDFRAVSATASKFGEKPPIGKPKELLVEKDGIRIELETGPKEGRFIITKVNDE